MTIQPAILNAQSPVRLHIERLVLDGVPLDRASGPILQAALETELARLFAEQGVPATLRQGSAVPRVSVPAVILNAGAKPAALGEQIAKAVYGGLSA
jgi:hypothetical protein